MVVEADRLQVAESLKVPALSVMNRTDPVGVVGLVDGSVTVAVHVAALFTVTVVGVHATIVFVECFGGTVTLRSKVPLLVTCESSPE